MAALMATLIGVAIWGWVRKSVLGEAEEAANAHELCYPTRFKIVALCGALLGGVMFELCILGAAHARDGFTTVLGLTIGSACGFIMVYVLLETFVARVHFDEARIILRTWLGQDHTFDWGDIEASDYSVGTERYTICVRGVGKFSISTYRNGIETFLARLEKVVEVER